MLHKFSFHKIYPASGSLVFRFFAFFYINECEGPENVFTGRSIRFGLDDGTIHDGTFVELLIWKVTYCWVHAVLLFQHVTPVT